MCRMAKFVAGSLNLIPVFDFHSNAIYFFMKEALVDVRPRFNEEKK